MAGLKLWNYLQENMDLYIVFFHGQVIGVDFPAQVELEVVETEPGIKGDTASGGTKPAKTNTGAVVKVPFFINELIFSFIIIL